MDAHRCDRAANVLANISLLTRLRRHARRLPRAISCSSILRLPQQGPNCYLLRQQNA
jgi:hypothetical protein